ncbi:MAG TPA: hypothetical protein VHH32_02290 [Gemmatimonadales bacterium]|nr:hypothetical protein [Gemmatimonadales bacterium]
MHTTHEITRSLSRRAIRGRVLALGVLALMGCESQSTAPEVNREPEEQVIDFELTDEGALAASTAHMIGHHKLPTVPLRHRQDDFNSNMALLDNSPFDLTYWGGPVITRATSYTVYVNCPQRAAVCWGNGTLAPSDFLRDLNRSDFMNIVREYTGAEAKGNFVVSAMRTEASFTNNRATLQQIFQILSDAVTTTGASGYTAIYHVFLPQGTEMCISAGNCYSPSDPASWTFCAFHGSVNFGATRHVLFTVEPYQGVAGCSIPGQTPQGLIDATASTLAHELFETITDPDLDGWSNGLFGYEISDLCSSFGSNQLLNGRRYFIQSEYSNKLHMCTNRVPV